MDGGTNGGIYYRMVEPIIRGRMVEEATVADDQKVQVPTRRPRN